MTRKQELCTLCGSASWEPHPYVGIGRTNLRDGSGPLVAHPVCGACHRDPAHRLSGPNVKMHFHARQHGVVALDAAQRMEARSKAGKELGF